MRKIEQSISFVAFSSLEFIDTVYIVSKITSCVITKSLITLFKVSVIFQILISFTILIIVTSTFARILSMIFFSMRDALLDFPTHIEICRYSTFDLYYIF